MEKGMNEDIIRMAREAGWSQKDIDSLLYIVETAAAAEREACALDAEWCIQNHLEHLMPERIRARSNT